MTLSWKAIHGEGDWPFMEHYAGRYLADVYKGYRRVYRSRAYRDAKDPDKYKNPNDEPYMVSQIFMLTYEDYVNTLYRLWKNGCLSTDAKTHQIIADKYNALSQADKLPYCDILDEFPELPPLPVFGDVRLRASPNLNKKQIPTYLARLMSEMGPKLKMARLERPDINLEIYCRDLIEEFMVEYKWADKDIKKEHDHIDGIDEDEMPTTIRSRYQLRPPVPIRDTSPKHNDDEALTETTKIDMRDI